MPDIQSRILAFVLTLPFEQALDFLVDLSARYILPAKNDMNGGDTLRDPLAGYLELLYSIGLSATSCLPEAVYSWVEQCQDLVIPRAGAAQDPGDRWKRLRDKDESPVVNDVVARSYALNMYLSRLADLDYSKGRLRKPPLFISNRTPKSLEPVREIRDRLVAYVKPLPFDQALDYFVQLSGEWVMRCDTISVLRYSLFPEESDELVENLTDEAVSKLLLKQIYYWFIDVH